MIDSINRDKPFDQFVAEQIAGDTLDDVTSETLVATGYWRLGIWDDEPADPLQARMDELDDLVATTCQVMIGLTVQCARCHDHKIDPIPQKDYYAMVALMRDVTPFATRTDGHTNNQVDVSPPEVAQAHADWSRQMRHLGRDRRELEQSVIVKFSAEDQRATEGPDNERREVLEREMPKHASEETLAKWRGLGDQMERLREQKESLPERTAVLGLGQTETVAPQTFVLLRGNPRSEGDPVGPAFPSIFTSAKPQFAPEESASQRRRALAQWLVSDENFLTARVQANRVWQNLMGRGLVRSSNNFGRMGTPPTHPELLDYLAARLIEFDWSVDRLTRLIVTSRTFRLASSADTAVARDGAAKDPQNDWYWRFDPRRLTAEEVRDSLLVATGRWNPSIGGPSVMPPLSAEVLAGQSRPGHGWSASSEQDAHRRSVYVHIKRSLLLPMLEAFDFPDPDLTCEARFQTLGPNQALAMLNSEFARDLSRRLAQRVWQPAAASDPAAERSFATGQLATGQLATGQFADGILRSVLRRAATSVEQQSAAALIDDLQAAGLSPQDARSMYALSVLNWNEFLFID